MNPHVDLYLHQRTSVEAGMLAIGAGRDSGLIVLPTGAGKTIVVMTLGRRLAWPMLFLVHRDRLIQQAVAAAARAWPEASVGVIQAERDEWGPTLFGPAPDLVIGAVQSLHPRRLERIPRDRFGLLAVDEAHHAPSSSWSRILAHFQSKFRLGVTATPKRLDGRGLVEWFGQEPLYSYSIFQAIKDRVLVPVDSKEIKTELDLSAIAVRGDFSQEQLARQVNTPSRNAKIVEAYQLHGQGRRAVAFCVDVNHCDSLAQHFAEAGLRAAAVHSQMLDDADAILDAFARGELDVVATCEMLTEGFDDPGVSCLLMTRPTMSRALYIQMIGRGLRQAARKTDCLVIDFTDNAGRHKLACSLNLFGKRKPEEPSAKAASDRDPDRPVAVPVDVPVLSWSLQESCPWPGLPTLADYVSVFPWDDEAASDNQRRYLQRFGVQVSGSLTKGEAGYLIDRCQEYEATFPAPATSWQREYLEQAGLWTEGMGKRQASQLIGSLKGQRGQPC